MWHSEGMGLLSWMFAGLIIGAIARFLVRGPHPLGCFGTIGLGIFGSIVGGTLLNVLGGDGLDVATSGFFGSVFGAVLLLVGARWLGQRNQLPPPGRR